ncbi:hypothetical protein B0P06_005603 [Clostridium saccharoperbutylacetonicum]|uniref:L-2-amino-thiazoline-4-carboxylic acid hydrolase n=1 Tax=Clostridium saccharoperbutylacetonicum N1-4(HMT) TaxID=931276 RepID=M1MXG2_9CLOT|nr:hypothetical protein [Clostridium saccharoperbutylacetonicum]AGF56137.1 hypothetical protein Cspa_c23720 [Clostridium saccharoperbutylacetonicum N1-4(HMT)]NRT63122.1 hypothetical protein [Clostridium saccharoperbutylacetonicum]NSB26480.1 hypothetical protein [Clostridium saccharoperbutylacetonicum]NSB45832.1 hypothetical protein [Clostridium saccharoperbutylacetonicum]
MSDFLKYWFIGFEKGLENLNEDEQCKLLSECGRACSESYSKKIYQEIWKKTKNYSEFFKILNDKILAVAAFEIEENKVYELKYNRCLCDLHTKGYVNTGSLCECSKQSLLYNLNSIFPNNRIQVILVDSILKGGKECVLRIYM